MRAAVRVILCRLIRQAAGVVPPLRGNVITLRPVYAWRWTTLASWEGVERRADPMSRTLCRGTYAGTAASLFIEPPGVMISLQEMSTDVGVRLL
jgi:hypothetical protein